VRLEVEAASCTRIVRIEGDQGRYDVTVDGRRWAVDAARSRGGAWSLLVGPAEAGQRDRRSYDVAVVEAAPGELTVHVNGRAVLVRIAGLSPGTARRGQPRLRVRDERSADARSGADRVAAPMPGRVVKLLVKPGDVVSARQGLVVVEAMKMENELRAARAGLVREVCVAEGASVEANTVLVVIE
jgi:biotin carboxyl carrier protein